MKLIVIETGAENHSEYTQRINSFDRREIELFNLEVSLATDVDYEEEISSQDVVVLGAGLKERAVQIARRCLAINPKLRIIMFADETHYSTGAFRTAHAAGIQKVLPLSASKMDFLQELVAIFDSLRRDGSVQEAKVVCVLQAKGGVGATTVSAALGDICNSNQRQTLLWDFDIDTVDLCRSLSMTAVTATPPSQWFEHSDITKASLQTSVVGLTDHVSLLPPPRMTMAEAFDFVGHTDSLDICGRTLDLARSIYDVVIIDSAAKLGPALGAVVSAADYIVVVIDDSVIGLTGLNLYLNLLQPLVTEPEKLLFLVNGGSKSSLAIREIKENLKPSYELGEDSWALDSIPFDQNCASWPGSGKTLYGLGSRETKLAIEQIAQHLKII